MARYVPCDWPLGGRRALPHWSADFARLGAAHDDFRHRGLRAKNSNTCGLGRVVDNVFKNSPWESWSRRSRPQNSVDRCGVSRRFFSVAPLKVVHQGGGLRDKFSMSPEILSVASALAGKQGPLHDVPMNVYNVTQPLCTWRRNSSAHRRVLSGAVISALLSLRSYLLVSNQLFCSGGREGGRGRILVK